MKSRKNILFQILFVTMLLIGVGLDVATHVLTEPQTTEQSASQHSDEEINNISDPDMFDDDQACEQSDYSIYADLSEQRICLADQSVYFEFTDKSWQPPQLT